MSISALFSSLFYFTFRRSKHTNRQEIRLRDEEIMSTRNLYRLIALTLFAALQVSIQMSAQDKGDSNNHQPRYRLVEIGTFGGPDSASTQGPPMLRILSEGGTALGFANTSTPDPYYPNCIINCYVIHGFAWRSGILEDLGALPPVNSSAAFGINERGLIVGLSQNGSIDPITGYPEEDAVTWRSGRIQNLGTLGGNNSLAFAVNDWGQVVGEAANAIPDDYAFGLPYIAASSFPVAQQARAFLWQNGTMHDLGTLGGNDAAAGLVNDLGQVAGISYTNSTPNPTTDLPTLHPFFWQNGRMVDIGSLGGTYGYANWLNHWGQVVGVSYLTGDQTFHPFLWNAGALRDLGTLGGSVGVANWVNDLGQVVGWANLQGDQANHGFLWSGGRKVDLGVVSGDACSTATSINLTGQIVGASGTCAPYYESLHAFLWENGTIYDLNTLIPPGSGLSLTDVFDINNFGEITGQGLLSNPGTHERLCSSWCGENDPVGCNNQLLESDSNAGASVGITPP